MIQCYHCEYEGNAREFGFKEGVQGKIPDKWTCPKCGYVSEYGF